MPPKKRTKSSAKPTTTKSTRRSRRRRQARLRALRLGGLLLTVGAILYFGLGAFLGFPPFGGEKTPSSNTQILLDGSSAMEERFFGGLTRMEAAVQAIDNQVLNQDLGDGSSLALRLYGGTCNGANGSLAVPFAPDNQDRIGAAFDELEIGGDATFAQGMAEGTRDFADAEQFAGELNTIIGIVGSGGFCARRWPPALSMGKSVRWRAESSSG